MADPYSFYIRPLLLSDIPAYLTHHQRCYDTSQLYLAESSSMPTPEDVASTISDPYPESLLLVAVPLSDSAARSAHDSSDSHDVDARDVSMHYVEHSMAQGDGAAAHPPDGKTPAILGHALVLPYDGGMLRASMAHASKVTVVMPGLEVLSGKMYDAVEQALFRELIKRSKARGWPYDTFVTKMPFVEGQEELVRAFDNCVDCGFRLVGREKGIVLKANLKLDFVTFQA